MRRVILHPVPSLVLLFSPCLSRAITSTRRWVRDKTPTLSLGHLSKRPSLSYDLIFEPLVVLSDINAFRNNCGNTLWFKLSGCHYLYFNSKKNKVLGFKCDESPVIVDIRSKIRF